MRAYSPISSNDETGYFELVIKVYWAGQLEAFPDGGKMSQHLESLAIGDSIEAKGPMGHITYLSSGRHAASVPLAFPHPLCLSQSRRDKNGCTL